MATKLYNKKIYTLLNDGILLTSARILVTSKRNYYNDTISSRDEMALDKTCFPYENHNVYNKGYIEYE